MSAPNDTLEFGPMTATSAALWAFPTHRGWRYGVTIEGVCALSNLTFDGASGFLVRCGAFTAEQARAALERVEARAAGADDSMMVVTPG